MKIKLKDLNYDGVWILKNHLQETDFVFLQKHFKTNVRNNDEYVNIYKNSNGKIELYGRDYVFIKEGEILLSIQEFRNMFVRDIKNKLK
jgi:chorismate-pyruvate lyase